MLRLAQWFVVLAGSELGAAAVESEAEDWKPQSEPQEALCSTDVEDILYGGARGGGKTDGLLGCFLEHAKRYGAGAHGSLFRKTLGEFIEIERRARIMYRAYGHYNETEHVWQFFNGATLDLCYLEHNKDANRYLGRQNTWLG